MSYLWIFIGGGLGSIARFALSGVVARLIGETFPWGTLLINVTGSFAIGFFYAATGSDSRLVAPNLRQFLTIGICGGYTTFSSFSWQTLSSIQDGDWLKAGANVLLSVVLCLVAVWLGHVAAMWINR